MALCTPVPADGYLVQEIDEELGPVRAQAAYVSLLQGEIDKAFSAFSALLRQQVGAALQVVATNNMLCLRAMKSDSAIKARPHLNCPMPQPLICYWC